MDTTLGVILALAIPGLIILILDRWFKGQDQRFEEVKDAVGDVDKKVDENHKELSGKLDKQTQTLHKRVTDMGEEVVRHDGRLNNLED